MNINMNEKTRVTLRTVCMLSLILMLGIGMTSCSPDNDNCTEERQVRLSDEVRRMSTFTIYSPLTADVVVPSGMDAVVNGELVTNGFDVISSGSSSLEVNGNLIIVGDSKIKFRNGEIEVEGDVNFNGCDGVVTCDEFEAEGNVNGNCGVIYYCDEFEVDGNINYDPFVQDCETLSSGGTFGALTKVVPCGLPTGAIIEINNITYEIVD